MTSDDTVAAKPVIWAISAWRAGDHAQVAALATALERAFGWRAEFKPPFDRRQDPGNSGYAAPWPDAVIGVGRGGLRLASWIKEQSGGHTRIIVLGRVEGSMDICDLVVTTAQYGLPDNANLIRLTLPFTPEIPPADEAQGVWRTQFGTLPRPLIGVLVGGPSSPLIFGKPEGERLTADLARLAGLTGGSLLIATGRRTPPEVASLLAHLAGSSPDRHRFLPFPPEGFQRPEDNPYPAILGMADRFVVTADSVSMLADAALTGRPISLFDLPVEPEKTTFKERLRRRRRRRFATGRRKDVIDHMYDWAVRRGHARPARHVPTLIAWLIRSGAFSGDPVKAQCLAGRLVAERETVLRRVRGLLAGFAIQAPPAASPTAASTGGTGGGTAGGTVFGERC
ncbi:ELM1/GtrOC1 family putative glycosyltransferase [Dongia soli]|uniref:ELM1/GtrOC1 family putative glycosyltransferase n=1 Tax=Dongia soli TaxID=600628 RepID=A0ABU5E8H0_9PROT|nr:ELM1/GtrOC1 family putative glycosyltransferase [Dongia soli]MDY0881900.1 ELM1/GtrOC1 family putative glycosyltransferase [Dongia soli]